MHVIHHDSGMLQFSKKVFHVVCIVLFANERLFAKCKQTANLQTEESHALFAHSVGLLKGKGPAAGVSVNITGQNDQPVFLYRLS